MKPKINKFVFPFSRQRALFSLTFCVAVALLMFTGMVMRLLSTTQSVDYQGTGAFRMFTIDSNCVVGICALLSIPYQVDGIRTGSYRMPKWIIYTLYVGVSTVTLTMLVTICILGPATGWAAWLFSDANLIFHIFNPILAILLFIFVTCEHKIKIRYSFVPVIPVAIYAIVYMVMVFIIGEENGGWPDHYSFGKYVPWPITLVVMILIAFLICLGLAAAHNLIHKHQEKKIKSDYKKAMESHHLSVEDAVHIMALEDMAHDRLHSVVTVPRQVILALMEGSHSTQTINELCELYLHTYLNKPEDKKEDLI